MLRAMQQELDREKGSCSPACSGPTSSSTAWTTSPPTRPSPTTARSPARSPTTSVSSASPSASATTPPTAAAAAATAPSSSPPRTTTRWPCATRSGPRPTGLQKRPARLLRQAGRAQAIPVRPGPAGLRPGQARRAVSPLVTLDIDRNEWKRRIVEASGLYASDPEVDPSPSNVQYSTANIRGIAVNRYLVNTEGTMVRQGYTGYNGAISVGGQAPTACDSAATTAPSPPPQRARERLRLPQARHRRPQEPRRAAQAPVVSAEDYHGPVLFSGDAIADVFTRLFVPNVEADRPEMGTTARTTGAYSSSYKSRVLPDMLSVTDDPLANKVQRQGPPRRLRHRRRRRPRAIGRHRRSTASSKTSSSAANPSRTSRPPTATAAPPPPRLRTRAPVSSSSRPTSPSRRTSSTSVCSPWRRTGQRRLRGRDPRRRTPASPSLSRPRRWHPPAGSRRRLRRARQPQPPLRHRRRRQRPLRLQLARRPFPRPSSPPACSSTTSA